MARGFKTGGRIAGTPNRKTLAVAELLAAFGHDPIEGMVKIARNPKASLELRGRMNAELASFIHAKRKPIEAEDPRDEKRPQTVEIFFMPSDRQLL